MAESLTDCLISVRNDLSQMKRVREYLESNTVSHGNCLITWRTIEAFNSILATCSSQDSPEVETLEILIDSFYYLARNNYQESVWNNFGFEMGVVCVKILSVIEQTNMFDDLFRKLLAVIEVICEHTSDVWKSVARQILNVLINKKFSPSYLETVIKSYLCVLKKVEPFVLNNFAKQNLNLLKTLSMLVQGIGDFEIQMDIMELIFLHIPDKEIVEDFFTESRSDVKELFQTLQFDDFDDDSRIYLNLLNKGAIKRKVFSLYCSVVYVGGCLVEPPAGKKGIWLDANKDSERLSLKCSDFHGQSDTQRVIYIQFSDLVSVKFGNVIEAVQKENRCLVIRTRNLEKVYMEVNSDDILCLALESDNTREGILEFADFLKEIIRKEAKKRKKTEVKLSQTLDNLFIDRDAPENNAAVDDFESSIFGCDLQDNAISSSVNHKLKSRTPEEFNLFENMENTKPNNPLIEISREMEKNLWSVNQEPRKISPISPVRQNVVPETQELSPNSFIESLNKNLGLDSPETRPSFEDVIPTVEFLGRSEERRSHKLFRSPEQIFSLEEPEKRNDVQEKENEPPQKELFKQPKKKAPTPNKRVLRERKSLECKLFNSQSEEYFRKNSNPGKGKKPKLPKLTKKRCMSTRKKKGFEGSGKKKLGKKTKLKQQTVNAGPHVEASTRPSLLDPNGYTYKRWIEPTTSERGNFWLKKLESLEKNRNASERVFDFDDSDDNLKTKRRSGGVVKSRKSTNLKGRSPVNRSALKEVKEILKSKDWNKTKRKKDDPGREKTKVNSISPRGNDLETKSRKQEETANNSKVFVPDNIPKSLHSEGFTKKSPEPEISSPDRLEHNYDTIAQIRTSSEENCLLDENSNKADPNDIEDDDAAQVDENEISENDESADESEDDDDDNTKTKKRERSEEENSLTKALIKKKPKTLKTNRKRLVPPVDQIRMQDSEERLRRETDEIIETINKATNHLLNHVAKKEADKMASYLKTVSEASSRLIENNDSEIRAMRIQKLITYYESGCSVSDFYESMTSELSKVRTSFKNLTEDAETSKKILRITHRLRGLIEYEVDRSIRYETKMKRDLLMKYMDEFGKSDL